MLNPVKYNFTDVLPSAQVEIYAINKIRTSAFLYYKAIARPQFAEMIF